MGVIPRIGATILIAAVSLVLPTRRGQDREEEYLGKFERETNPIHRAKLMPKLGAAEFNEMEKDVNGGDIPAALSLLEKYRDQAQSCVKGLDGAQPDAERHPAGFKELQISLREALRRLDNMMADMTRDQQQEFRGVRMDLDQMNRHVIQELFPRQPLPAATPNKAKS